MPEVGAGSLVTVTAQVAVKPPSLVVAVMVAVPRLLPVTVPSAATEATLLLEELQLTLSSEAVAGRTDALRTAVAPGMIWSFVLLMVTPVAGTFGASALVYV